MTGDITIAMTLKNSSRTLPDVLKAISQINGIRNRIKLVFVDAKSSDGSWELLQDFKGKHKGDFYSIELLSQDCDITEGRNICINRAQGLFILFVDSDVVIPSELVREIEETFLSNPRLAFINVPCIVEGHKKGWLDKFFDSIKEPMGMSCAAIRISALQEVGPYFTGLPGGENPNELILRLRKKGYENMNFKKAALHIKQKPRGFLGYVKSSFHSSTFFHLQEIKAGNRYLIVKYIYYTALLASLFLTMISPYPFILLGMVGMMHYLLKSKGNPIVLPALLVGMILPIGLLYWILRGMNFRQNYKKAT